tara:strand:+ start:697 stop:867 length:171 start_codon:yes stop_codon:yes gene_type:complete
MTGQQNPANSKARTGGQIKSGVFAKASKSKPRRSTKRNKSSRKKKPHSSSKKKGKK